MHPDFIPFALLLAVALGLAIYTTWPDPTTEGEKLARPKVDLYQLEAGSKAASSFVKGFVAGHWFATTHNLTDAQVRDFYDLQIRTLRYDASLYEYGWTEAMRRRWIEAGGDFTNPANDPLLLYRGVSRASRA